MRFHLLDQQSLPVLQAEARFYRHDCGLELFCLDKPDRENLFAILFHTPAKDHSGVAHIVEHTVLSGSRKYPLKDPFIELAKSSLATFLNALTFADCTLYPICSCHAEDYFNLASVYWDAVFNPLLHYQSFQQEAWHYELERRRDGSAKLGLNGIVLNEMSAAYTELENVLERHVFAQLLPDTPLAFDSGGHPEHIPGLSYDEFLKFHKTHYQISQAKIIVSGNIATESKLAFIEERLRELAPERTRPQANVRAVKAPRFYVQRSWRRPRHKTAFYVPQSEGDEAQAAFALAWRIDDKRDPELDLAMQLLDLILLGNAAAPLQKSLLESDLCSALTCCGYDNNYCQTIFQIGLKGCRKNDFAKIEELVSNCLLEQSQGIAPSRVKNALLQLKLNHREIDAEHNLDVLEDILAAWNYDCHPLLFVKQKTAHQSLEERLNTEAGYLENIIKRYLLDNPHRLSLELLPDPMLLQKKMRRIRRRLHQLEQTLSAAELAQISREQLALRARQEQPDSAAALRSLPRLRRLELQKLPLHLPVSAGELANSLPLLRGEVFSNGLTYMQLAFDLGSLPQHLHSTLPFFNNFFPQVGTKELSYVQVAENQAACSAVLSSSLHVCQSIKPGEPTRKILRLSMHCLQELLPQALELFDTQLKRKSFREAKRLRELLKQNHALALSELQAEPALFANLRSAVGLTPAAKEMEQWNGLAFLQNCQHWIQLPETQLKKKTALLDELCAWLAEQSPLLAATVGDNDGFRQLSAFLEAFPGRASQAPANIAQPDSFGRQEYYALHADTNSFVRSHSAPGYQQPQSAALELYAQLLSCGYLWQELRLKNGAYGVSCRYSPLQGILSLQSSEDPNPQHSRSIFDRLKLDTAVNSWSKQDIDDAIIACSRDSARPWCPAETAKTALLHRLCGIDEAARQERRDALLQQSPQSMKAAIQEFWQNYAVQYNDCLIGEAGKAKKMRLQALQI